MTIKVLYFAHLREQFGIAEESLEISPTTVAALLEHLRRRGGIWAQALDAGQSYRVAVNHELAELTATIGANDEIAIFPPVTGG